MRQLRAISGEINRPILQWYYRVPMDTMGCSAAAVDGVGEGDSRALCHGVFMCEIEERLINSPKVVF